MNEPFLHYQQLTWTTYNFVNTGLPLKVQGADASQFAKKILNPSANFLTLLCLSKNILGTTSTYRMCWK